MKSGAYSRKIKHEQTATFMSGDVPPCALRYRL